MSAFGTATPYLDDGMSAIGTAAWWSYHRNEPGAPTLEDLEREEGADVEGSEREKLQRSFAADVAVSGDGRTIDLRVVPYGVVATVADPPTFRPYREEFLLGAFERQLAAPDRLKVWLNFEHEQGIRGIVGHGAELREQSDGLRGSFRVHANADGDKALQLVNDGLLGGVSGEFIAFRSRTTESGVVQRLRAHLDKVSLCRSPAYTGAQVLAVREEPQAELERELDVPTLRPELLDRMSALGVAPLERIAVTSRSWDGSPGRFSDDEYRRAALFCRGTGSPPKQDCSLPVLEPDGTLNVNALGAAAAALAGARGGLANTSRAQKATAARKLIRYYSLAKMEPPASLVALARS